MQGEKGQVKDKYDRVRIIRTARDTDDRISEVEIIEIGSKKEESTISVQIDPYEQHHSTLGFGGAFTEAGAYVLSKINRKKRQEVIEAYFSPYHGLNYSLCRVHMNSCDFSLGNYSCDDTDGDIELKNFNINRDREYLIPFIKDAIKISKSPIRLLVSPWSPPAWMKTNGKMNFGGSLKRKYLATWALFFSKFIQEYEKENIAIWGVSVQNEPLAKQIWESCLYTAEEERDFVRNHLGPLLQKNGLADKKILIWDHNRDLLYERAKIILSSQEAAKYIWGIGFHWYSGDQFDNVAKTYHDFPDKHLLFTEGCIEGGVKLGQWDRGEIYAHNIIGDLKNGTEGWIDWNMVLDHTGGPNHAGNLCDAPIIIDTNTGKIHYQSSYYYIGHFSKYIHTGAKHISCRSNDNNLEMIAFLNPDSKIIFIVLNRKNEDIEFTLELSGYSVPIKSLRHSIQTLIIE